MTLAQHIELSMKLSHEFLVSLMDSGGLMDCAEANDIHIQDLTEHLKFLDNLFNNQ